MSPPEAAAKSGAKAFLIGFESLQEKTLSGLGKNMNLRPTTRNFKESIKTIEDHGRSFARDVPVQTFLPER